MTAAAEPAAPSTRGQLSPMLSLALKLLGREAPVYDGSWAEWEQAADAPVAAAA